MSSFIKQWNDMPVKRPEDQEEMTCPSCGYTKARKDRNHCHCSKCNTITYPDKETYYRES